MKVQKILLGTDVVIQTFLFYGAVLTALGTLISGGGLMILLGFGLLALGGWQLGSGLIMGIILKDNLRAKYFFGSIFYLLILYGGANFFNKMNGSLEVLLGSIGIVVIPLCIAFWYFRLTRSTLEKLNELGDVVESPEEMENILDSEEIFKTIEKL